MDRNTYLKPPFYCNIQQPVISLGLDCQSAPCSVQSQLKHKNIACLPFKLSCYTMMLWFLSSHLFWLERFQMTWMESGTSECSRFMFFKLQVISLEPAFIVISNVSLSQWKCTVWNVDVNLVTKPPTNVRWESKARLTLAPGLGWQRAAGQADRTGKLKYLFLQMETSLYTLTGFTY